LNRQDAKSGQGRREEEEKRKLNRQDAKFAKEGKREERTNKKGNEFGSLLKL
jgi:hypothetical protein